MRLARTVMLAALTALAAFAFAAASANAEDVEVSYEENGTGHCPAATMSAGHSIGGGCRIHATSESNAVTLNHTGAAEAVTSSCANEFWGRVGENGEGWIEGSDAMIATNPGAGCVITPCDEAGGGTGHPELEWPVHVEEVATATLQMHVTFCIRPFNTAEGAGNTPCTIEVNVTPIGPAANHDYEFRATEAPCAEDPRRELTGHWRTEAVHNPAEEAEIEIRHLP